MRVCPLSQVETEEMAGLFSEELEDWRRQLGWDYQPAVKVLKRCLEQGTLPGLVLRDRSGQLAGYCYYVLSPPVAYIGTLYLRPSQATRRGYALLLDRLLEEASSWGEVVRIEAQIFAFNRALAPLFEERGFRVIRRHFLSAELESLPRSPRVPPPFSLTDWRETHLAAAAQIVYDSYRDSPDFELCHDYQTPQGCLRFLRNLLLNPGCGTFSPETSCGVLDAGGDLCGLLMSSMISPKTGMIPQISVRRDSQGKGVGRALLAEYCRRATGAGLERVALSVSEPNRGAHRLYLDFGFKPLKIFHAFVWEKEEQGRPAKTAKS